jgi:RNA polymerase sigma-70 factor (ECF subfamily)
LRQSQATEKALIEGCKRGDPLLQRALFETYAGKMMSVCRRYSKDKMEAEDSLQIGFVKVFENINQLKNDAIEGWMKKIFLNTCLNAWRKNKSSILVVEEQQRDEIDAAEDSLQRLQAAELLELIDRLPQGAKVIFNLFALEGYSHSEISVLLNITESASRAQLTRARQLLQQRIQSQI